MPDKVPSEFIIETKYSRDYRIVSIDAVYGGLSADGKEIEMNLGKYTKFIPRYSKNKIDEHGHITSDEGIMQEGELVPLFVRTLEIEVLLDLQAAKGIRAWLDNYIKEIEKSAVK